MAQSHTASFLVIVVSVGLGTVYSRDASYIRQSDSQNWPKLSVWDSGQKNATTPWPALGNNRFQSNSYTPTNPTWVRQNSAPMWQNQIPQSNLNTVSIEPRSSDEVTDDELREFSETLLNKDVNNAAQYVSLNVQRKTTSRSTKDEAPAPLLSVDKKAFQISTIKKLIPLHDNYVVESKEVEQITNQEKQEEDNLLNEIVNTAVMQSTRNLLMQKGKIGRDPNEFKNILKEIWFNMYSRGGRKVGSSGFEHVFLTEVKNNQISGLHNWIYFDEAENKGQANYLGYMKKIDLGNKGAILKFHFTFNGIDKPVGSMFIGTSPEFEMALYTTCFMLRADKICPLKLDGKKFIIRTYTYRYGGKKLIGSAFPEI